MFGVMRPPRCLVFGAGKRASLSGYAREMGTHALIVTDERLAGDALFREMMAALSASGVRATVYSGTIEELPSTCITHGLMPMLVECAFRGDHEALRAEARQSGARSN